MSIIFSSGSRVVVKRISPRIQPDGDRAMVRRSIGSRQLNTFDPFLLLDEATFESPAGFPDHPHRGFGSVTHEDFEGHKGILREGGIQWMTAGRGIMHSEKPPPTGSHRVVQLWVNLSSKEKMVEPKYQEAESKDIAEAEIEGVKVRIIAGEAMGVKSHIFTRTPTMYLDFTIQPGFHFQQPIPRNWNAFVYVLDGEGGVFGDSKAKPTPSHHLLLLGSGDSVEAWNKSSTESVRFILVAGQPLNEPIARYGPFVMNTQDEIDQAIFDYNNCANGFEKARLWRSRNNA